MLPALSIAVQTTAVDIPTVKAEPDTGLHVKVGDWSKLSLTVGLLQDTGLEFVVKLAGQAIVGAVRSI